MKCQEVMINPIENALEIAIIAHTNQKDKAGLPYILHPLAVMNLVETIEEKTVAILHDVVEDSDITLEFLFKWGFSTEIVEAVDGMTHRPYETNLEYWNRLKQNPIAKVVKKADIRHNVSPKRMRNLDTKTRNRLINKYREALKVINGD
mgnify:CR=1 FL=1